MKRILKLLVVLMFSLLLVSCKDSVSFPKVNEKNKVELTSEELTKELEGVSFNDKILKIAVDLDINMSGTKSKVDGIVYASETKSIMEINMLAEAFNTKTSGKAKYYFFENHLYFDGSIVSKVGEISTEIKGKYEFPLDGGFMFEDVLDFDDIFELDVNEAMKDSDFIKLIEEYEGLTFYKSKNKFQIKLEINNELLLKNKELLNFILDEITEPTDGQTLKFEVILTIENKNIVEFGYLMEISDPTTDNHIKMMYAAKTISEMPKMPDFTDFKPFN